MTQNVLPVRPQVDVAFPTSPTSLAPWQLAFAEWLANLDRAPSTEAQLTKVIEFRAAQGIPDPFTDVDLRALVARRHFKEYVSKLNADALKRCRARIEARLEAYVDANAWALTQAKGAMDYRAVAAITEPMMERVWPKKSDTAANTSVTVVLMPAQQAAIHAIETVEVMDAEIVAIERDG